MPTGRSQTKKDKAKSHIINNLLTSNVRSLQENFKTRHRHINLPRAWSIRQVLSLKFSRNFLTVPVNKVLSLVMRSMNEALLSYIAFHFDVNYPLEKNHSPVNNVVSSVILLCPYRFSPLMNFFGKFGSTKTMLGNS